MFVEGNVVLNDETALVVPQDSVLKLNDKTFCFKAVGGNRFQEVPVTVSRQDDTAVAIAEGLAVGDEVVATDPANLDHVLDSGRVAN
jgi:multidrug efflux pump subunit AcrA (membrane-fusion protein)